MAPSETAVLLRAALRYINSISSNTNFYDNKTGQSYNLEQTLLDLDAAYPEPWTDYERALLQVFSNNGLDNGERYIIEYLRKDCDYSDIENGSALNDSACAFDAGVAFGRKNP